MNEKKNSNPIPQEVYDSLARVLLPIIKDYYNSNSNQDRKN
jgi:hypothetical protein